MVFSSETKVGLPALELLSQICRINEVGGGLDENLGLPSGPISTVQPNSAGSTCPGLTPVRYFTVKPDG